MKKYLRITALVLVTSMLLALVPFTISAASVLTSKKIVCFGDSLTHFGDKSKPALGTDEYGNQVWQDDYPSHLATMLGTTVYNAGVGGHTTDDGLSRIDVEALAQNPDIMVICLGMNDQARAVATGLNLTSIESYAKNLQIFVDKAKAKGVDVVFLTGTGTYKASGYYQPGTADYSYGTNVADYMNVMREIAIKNNCGLVDALYEFSVMPPAEYFLAGDGLHHSNKGREYFASLVAEHLKAIYDGTNKASMNIVCKDENGKQLARYTISGAAGAMITVASPDLGGYTPITADVKTTFVNGATHTFTYTSTAKNLIKTLVTGYQIDDNVANSIYKLYDESKALMSATNVDFTALKAKSNEIGRLLGVKDSKELILSGGAKYTASAPTYTYWNNAYHSNDVVQHRFVDDGIRLTDGVKGYGCGSDSRYSAWSSDAEIVIDLGNVKTFDVVNIYVACDEWGVAAPKSFSVAYSADGATYTSVANADGTLNFIDGYVNSVSGDNIWGTKKLNFALNAPVSGRYVKVNIPRNGLFLWVDEVEVAKKTPAPVYGQYEHTNIITGVNAGVITNEACFLYTGPQTLTNLNFKWTASVLAKWDSEKKAYIITQTKPDDGNAWDLTLAADEIFLAAHDLGWYNYYTASNAQVGQVLEISRFDGANSVAVAPKYSVYDYVAPHDCTPKDDTWQSDANNHWQECSCGEKLNTAKHDNGAWKVTKPNDIDVVGKKELQCTVCGYKLAEEDIPAKHEPATDKWFSDANNHWQECSCGEKLNTAKHDDGAWKVTKPAQIGVKGEKELRCTVCNYLLKTEAIDALTPDHVCSPENDSWQSDVNNHWQECSCGEKLNTAKHDNGEWITVKNAEIGVEGKKELRCTVCGYVIDTDTIPALKDENQQPPVNYVKGDVNGSGKIDARDYLLLKRAYFGTYTLTCDLEVADINDSGKIDARDYLLLKRAYFGTYTIE